MQDDSIVCPHCKQRIPLSKALSGQVEERVRHEVASEIQAREKQLAEDYDKRLAQEKKTSAAKAKREMKTQLDAVEDELAEKRTLLEKAEKKELELIKTKRGLEEKQKRIELDVARRVDEESKRIEKTTVERVAEENRLKDLEKEKQLSDLRRQIEVLKHKASQGSQQVQGEVIEIELEEALRAVFPHDFVEPVPKGVRGADVLHRVNNPTGQLCGTIIWELKNTKSWNDGWLAKLKDDQRAQKADLAVLVSVVLPPNVRHFALLDGVWVCDRSISSALASSLRHNLIQVSLARGAAEGKADKMELLYTYLSGIEFRQRVEAILEPLIAMRDDLDRERRAMETSWTKREKQLVSVTRNLAGMYGEVQGIIGATLPAIEALALPAPAVEGRRLKG